MAQLSQAAVGAKRESYWVLIFASLRYRNFRLVWLGSATEHLGEFMQTAAVLWLANEMTHSALMLTIVGTCVFIPMVFLPMIAGVVADRVDRRNLLIVALLGSALLSIWITVLVVTGAVALWHLIVFRLLGGVLMSFNHPARFAILPNLVDRKHLLNAVSLDSFSVQATRLIGMLIVGYLMALVGTWPIFAIGALGYLLAILWLLRVRLSPTTPATRRQAPWQYLADGFSYLRTNALVLGLILLYLIPWLASNTSSNFMPIFADDILHVGAVGYGYLQAASGLGAIASLIILTILNYYRRKTALLVGAGIIMGISLIGFSASPWLSLSLALQVVIGGVLTAMVTLNTVMIQGAVPDEVRGRVMSWREVAFGLGPTGSILFGAIAQYTGVPISLGLLGVICLIASLVLIAFLPRFKSIE